MVEEKESGVGGRTGRRWWAAGVALAAVLVLGGYALQKWRPSAAAASEDDGWNAPAPVRTVEAVHGDLAVRIQAIGTVTPLNTVTVRSRVEGPLSRVLFTEGQQVARGQLLAEIDPAAYRVRLAQAEGQQQRNEAELKNAESTLARYRLLFEQDSLARQQLDAQEALVNQLRGTLRSDAAQVEDARLQLSWTRIEAPITGRLGLRRVDAGNLVRTGDEQGLVTITQTQPVAVVFNVPQAQVPAVRAALAQGRTLDAEVWDRGEQQRLAQGRLATLDNQIDAATGTLRMKAQFGNADDALFPNQFVNLRLHVQTLKDAVVLPAEAVQFGSQGAYVYVVAGGKSLVRKVTPGVTDAGRVAVAEGLQGGEQVVLEGLDRLRDGREVVVVESGERSAGAAAAPAAAAR